MPSRIKNRLESFWSKARKTKSCWFWEKASNGIDYGVVRWRWTDTEPMKMRLAHRISWELTNGPVPKGVCVLHRCDNPRCINPDHLYLGTHADNMRDIAIRERNSRMKLNNKEVNEIRNLMDNGANAVELSRKFGVDNDTITAIARRIKRKSVPEAASKVAA